VTIKLQKSKICCKLIAMLFCMLLFIPAWASGGPAGSTRAGALIDQPVFNGQGREIGELDDLVIKRNGKVKRAIISVGGLLDVGDKLISFRYRAMKFSEGKIILDINQKQFESRPEFDYYQHDLFTSYHHRLYPHGMMPGPVGPLWRDMPPGYHMQWSGEGSRMSQNSQHGDKSKDQPAERPDYGRPGGGMHDRRVWYNSYNWAYFPERMLAGVVLGQRVINRQGEEVATVEDLIISATGRVEKVVLSYGGFLDIGDHLAVVPYRTIGFTNRGITYDISRREIKNLPKYRY
jgi:sporulation protein YlmC with PRC-barrel domain